MILRFSAPLIFASFLALTPFTAGQAIGDNEAPVPTLAIVSDPSGIVSYEKTAPLPVLRFVGEYQPDGVFSTAPSASASRTVRDTGEFARYRDVNRFAEVPRFIDLDARERSITNFKPPHRAATPVKGHTLFTTVRDHLVLIAYGRRNLLRAPTHVVVDSMQRLIVSDPDLNCIHVIGSTGAFRIEGGADRRFKSPDGVAIDAADNIYVSDAQDGIVQVFDHDGHFLHSIGIYRGERRFDQPTAIAINRKRGLLYVLDGPSREVVALDLEGNYVSRINRHSRSGVDLIYPSEIAVSNEHVVVLDDYGSRVLVFDKSFELLNSFRVQIHNGPPRLHEVGLSVDAFGRVYLSNVVPDRVTVYSQAGKVLGVFGHTGNRSEEFRVPSGLWVDSEDRVYVADTDNSRVQVFQTVGTDRVAESAAERR